MDTCLLWTVYLVWRSPNFIHLSLCNEDTCIILTARSLPLGSTLRDYGMKMWSSQLYHNLSNCKISPKKRFQGFNRIRTHGLCIRAVVLYHLSYKDPYNGKQANLLSYVVSYFFNSLSSRKLHFYQWKPRNNSPVLLKVNFFNLYCRFSLSRNQKINLKCFNYKNYKFQIW